MRYIRTGLVVAISVLPLLLVAEPALAACSSSSGGLQNPLNSQYCDIPSFLSGALRVLVIVALPIISLFIVVAGFLFIFARGNSSELEKAKKNFFYVILGALLILGAWLIATLIGATVTQLVGS